MSNNETTKVQEQPDWSVVSVPTELVDKVLDYVNSLEEEDSDVTGHMLSRLGGVGSIGGTLNATTLTSTTPCTSKPGAFGGDIITCDADTVLS